MTDNAPSSAPTPSQTPAWSLLRAPLSVRLAIAGTAVIVFWLAVLAALR